MHDIVKLDLKANIHDENDHIAQHVKEHMTEDNVLVINVMGAPGVGKTTTLKKYHSTFKRFKAVCD